MWRCWFFCPSGSGSPYPVSKGHYTWSVYTKRRTTDNTCHSSNTQASDNSLEPDKVNQIQSTIYGYLSTAEGALTGSIIQNPTDGNFQVLEGLETTTDGVGSGLKLNLVISGGPMNGGTGASNVTAISVHTAGKDYKPDDTVTVSHLFMANTEVDLVLRLRDQDFQTICKRYKYDAMYLSLYNDQGGERVRSTQHVCPAGSYCRNGHIWEHLPGYFGRTNGSYNATGSGNASLDSIALPVRHHLNKSHVGGHMYTVPVVAEIPHQYRGDITHQLVGILSPMLLIRQQGTCSHHQKMVA